MTPLMMIVLATLFGGLLSMAMSASLVFRLSRKTMGVLVAFSAGVMLSSALLDILPEALSAVGHDEASQQALFITLLAGLVGFFALERLALWHHAHAPDEAVAGAKREHVAAPLILIGDAFHNFVDGLLLAAAFLTDPMLGLSTTLAIVAHETPQELGDFVLLLNAGWSRRKAFLANAASSLTSVLGGLLGYFVLAGAGAAWPYILTLAAASFIYIALADLMPLLHRQGHNFAVQSALIASGVLVVPLVSHWVH